MTRAPQALVDSRKLMLDNLDVHPGKTVEADLDPAEVGIVGDTAHVVQGDSYHLGLPQQKRTGYSVTESARDTAGLADLASAVDIGWFEWRNPKTGKVHNLRTFSAWVVAQMRASAPDAADIREVIYSLDGKTVKREDRLKKRTSGDKSHLTHTHLSVFRDAVKAGRGLVPLFRRYLTEIGLLAGEDEDMGLTPDERKIVDEIQKNVQALGARVNMLAQNDDRVAATWSYKWDPKKSAADPSQPYDTNKLKLALAELPAAVVDGLTGQDDATVAAALKAALGKRAAAIGALLQG